METRAFGRTGLKTSILGFGCGAVGGLMVRGAPGDQERTVAEALDAGINYFDTAPLYGNGQSETNLGRILKALKPANVIVGTKVRLRPEDLADVRGAVAASLDASLARLGMERVDILHLHNVVTAAGGGESISARQVLDDVVPAFDGLRQAGKMRFSGVTAIGDTAALHQVIDGGGFGSAQVVYNMLNPSAAGTRASGLPGQDYAALLDRTRAAGTGVVGIRVLAGGALSGSAERHPIASAPPRRSARPHPMRSMSSMRGDCCRWSRRDTRRAWPRPPCALPSAIRRSERSWSAWPRRTSSGSRWPPCARARCRMRH